jgi:hypothetical protein
MWSKPLAKLRDYLSAGPRRRAFWRLDDRYDSVRSFASAAARPCGLNEVIVGSLDERSVRANRDAADDFPDEKRDAVACSAIASSADRAM